MNLPPSAPSTTTARLAPSYRERRRGLRALRRARANRDVKRPLARTSAPASSRASSPLLGFVGASLLLHPALGGALSLLPKSEARLEANQTIQVHIMSAQPAPVPSAPLREEPKPIPPQPQPQPSQPEPQRIAPRQLAPKPTLDEAPPDPVATEPNSEPADSPPRRIVGLSMESTTTGGADAALAVGNTRMGRGPKVAHAPLPSEGGAAPAFVPPRRKVTREPAYPPQLRSRNIEGDVRLGVEIDQTGRVTRVTVVRRSQYPEFDRAAVDAATAGTYEPARSAGTPVAHAIEFTVRFRLH